MASHSMRGGPSSPRRNTVPPPRGWLTIRQPRGGSVSRQQQPAPSPDVRHLSGRPQMLHGFAWVTLAQKCSPPILRSANDVLLVAIRAALAIGVLEPESTVLTLPPRGGIQSVPSAEVRQSLESVQFEFRCSNSIRKYHSDFLSLRVSVSCRRPSDRVGRRASRSLRQPNSQAATLLGGSSPTPRTQASAQATCPRCDMRGAGPERRG